MSTAADCVAGIFSGLYLKPEYYKELFKVNLCMEKNSHECSFSPLLSFAFILFLYIGKIVFLAPSLSIVLDLISQ